MGATSASPSLSERLKGLRSQVAGTSVTQKQVADALGVSVSLVSSWESGKAVPGEDRLLAYALLFADDNPGLDGGGSLPDEAELTIPQEERRRQLIGELFALREFAQRGVGGTAPGTGALGGRLWFFPEGARIRIITTPMFQPVLERIPYADPWHPNYMAALHDADRDAAMELFGHIRAENPTADVRCLTADKAGRDDLTGFVVVLGQGDTLRLDAPRESVLGYLIRRLELPWGTRVREGGDNEFDSEFVVTTDADGTPTYCRAGQPPVRTEVIRPVFLRDETQPGRPRSLVHGYPQLEYDVAVLARRQNELHLGSTVTIISGIFSRGTYGAVRALTDPVFRVGNEQYLAEHLPLDNFWMFFHVPIYSGATGGLETIPPDLTRPFNRIRASQ